jgi:uncharacterized protein (TIGR00369 family)
MTDAEIRAFLTDPACLPPATRLLGFELLDFSVTEGWAEVAFTPPQSMLNPIGAVQGGFVTAMLDEVMGVAASIHRRFEIVVPTLSITTNFCKPTPIARLVSRGEVVRIGATSAHLQGWLRDDEGVLLAAATASATVRAHPRHLRVRSGG